MERSEELLKKTAATLEKYKKNKTLVSPEDLAGTYKVPFERLKAQLKDELLEFLKTYSLEELAIRNDNSDAFKEFIAAVEGIFSDRVIGKQISIAVYQEFDLDKVKKYAEELRQRVYHEAWFPYFQTYTCLYATAECFVPENPQTPRIYNRLVDKFWDDENDEWISNEGTKGPVVLIYFQEGEK